MQEGSWVTTGLSISARIGQVFSQLGLFTGKWFLQHELVKWQCHRRITLRGLLLTSHGFPYKVETSILFHSCSNHTDVNKQSCHNSWTVEPKWFHPGSRSVGRMSWGPGTQLPESFLDDDSCASNRLSEWVRRVQSPFQTLVLPERSQSTLVK